MTKTFFGSTGSDLHPCLGSLTVIVPFQVWIIIQTFFSLYPQSFTPVAYGHFSVKKEAPLSAPSREEHTVSSPCVFCHPSPQGWKLVYLLPGTSDRTFGLPVSLHNIMHQSLSLSDYWILLCQWFPLITWPPAQKAHQTGYTCTQHPLFPQTLRELSDSDLTRPLPTQLILILHNWRKDKREDTATHYDACIWTLKPELLNLAQDSDSPTWMTEKSESLLRSCF